MKRIGDLLCSRLHAAYLAFWSEPPNTRVQPTRVARRARPGSADPPPVRRRKALLSVWESGEVARA
jgi:hypothetical protein